MSISPSSSAPDALRAAALTAVKTLQQAGFIAYWAGGCVRDQLLGRIPKDYDIATNATPEEVIQLFPNAVEVGVSFGVVSAACQGERFEIATFRQDHGYTDGRHPSSVTFVTAEEDAHRRDFTVNALFYDPVAETLHDFVDGQADIDAGCIRCVGRAEDRFREDHLRMLRAVRFSTTLGFSLAEETQQAIQRLAGCIKDISVERIQTELTRSLLEAEKAGDAIRLLDQCGLLVEILPEVVTMKGQEQPPQWHPEGDVFTHTLLMLDHMKARSLQLAYAALLHDIGKPATAMVDGDRIRFNCHAHRGAEIAEEILLRLRLPRRDIAAIVHAVKNHMRFSDVPNMRRAKLRRLIGAETFNLELELHRLDCISSHRLLENYNFLLEFRKQMESEPVLPPPWIRGDDVMALGVQQGPEIGVWMRRAYDAQLEGHVTDRSELLRWLKKEIGLSSPE